MSTFEPDSPEVVESFEKFFERHAPEDVAELAQHYPKNQRSIWIDHSDLYTFDPNLADDLIDNPRHIIECAEKALKNVDVPVDATFERANVRIYNLTKSLSVTEVDSMDIESYVEVSGQLTRITDKNPRLKVGVYECKRCYTSTRIPQPRNEVHEPHECQGCERKGPFVPDTRESTWVDQRKIKLAEPIEERSQARGESIPVYVEDDLCDYGPGSTKLPDHTGEHATVAGIVRINESKLSKSPESEVWIDAKAITFDTTIEEDIDIEEHRDEFERTARRDDAVDLVAESLAPSLHAEEGDDLYPVRRACAAWLFNAYRLDPGGAEYKRGDLHMALIGDPGTGKSTLMAYLHEVLPKSEYRTGPGLSKAGLTSAAVQEEFAGSTEWTLQPGVLPRADGGHCIIDEVDAIVDENTKAIHDALEGEQVVKADKAGIQADLPSRCALLAGGNPTYTRFDPYEPITEQIDLDPALFDRMDLVFALEDEVDESRDRKKAEHTLDTWDELTRAENGTLDIEEAETTQGPVSKETLRAWVKYARDNVRPTLTDEAKGLLSEYYVEVRDLNDAYEADDGDDVAVAASMRTLEAGIRLSIAFARLRLSETVEPADAERAIELSKRVVGMRFDPESGQFDMSMVTSGTTHSQKSRRRKILEIISEPDEAVRHETVVAIAVNEMGMDEAKVENTIRTLKQSGEIFDPERNDAYRTT